MRITTLVAFVFSAFPAALTAQSAGLLITNDDYDIVDDLRRGNQMADAASRLEDGGMRVISAP